MDDEKQYPPALVELFDLIMNPAASAGVELVKKLEPVFKDAERYRWLRARAERTSDLEPPHWEFPAASGIGATPDDAIDEAMLATRAVGAA